MFPRRRVAVSPLPQHDPNCDHTHPRPAPPSPSPSLLSSLVFGVCFTGLGLVLGVLATLLWTRFIVLPPVYVSPAPPQPTGVVSASVVVRPSVSASVVLMHWKRDTTLNTVLVAACKAQAVTEVVVWDANPLTKGATVDVEACTSASGGTTHVRVMSVSHDVGLHSRFAAAQLATNDAVVVMDDDMFMSPEGIDAAVLAWEADTDVIHGLYGRWPTQSLPYSRERLNLPTAPIVLTKFLVAHRRLFAEFFRWAPAAEQLPAFAQSKPRWNGEDILFALAVLRANEGRQHRLHPELKQHLKELHTTTAISGALFDHEIYRREFVAGLTQLMGFQWPPSFANYPDRTDVVIE